MKPASGLFNGLLWGMVLFGLSCCLSPAAVRAGSADELFAKARSDYQTALTLPDRERKVQALQGCIEQLKRVLREDGAGKLADKCYYLIGQSYHRMHDTNRNPQHLKAAIENYRTVVEKFPASPLADDAQYLIGILYMADDPAQAYIELAKVRLFFPKGDMSARASKKADELAGRIGCKKPMKKDEQDAPTRAGKEKKNARPPGAPPSCPTVARLEKVQHWSGKDYTRVVLYMSGPVTYKENTIPADPKAKQPGKIYVELENCVIKPSMKSQIRIMDQFLQQVRAEQCDAALARIVLDTEPIDSYRVFPLADPTRLIIDVKGKASQPAAEAPKQGPKSTTPPGQPGQQMPSLARQLGLDVKCIVIDPGHGGKDKGAISPNKVYEKDIVLSISKRLQKVLQAKTACQVILTRTRDRFISLEERTAIANSKKADLFISVHTNANEDGKFHGVETYFLNLSKDKESARVAAFENATSTKKISDLEAILHDLMLNTKINESARLATSVQKRVVKNLQTGYENVRDLGTKQAPFYVLLGAEMPSILIETAFITNEQEEERLRDARFQDELAKGIAAGVEVYIGQMKGLAKVGGRP